MGLFDKFRRKSKATTQAKSVNAEQYKQYLEIARIISCGNKDVIREVLDYFADSKRYFFNNKEQYEELGMEEFEDSDYMNWISIISILEKYNYVCERDWKDAKEDFIYFVENLVGMKENNVYINPDWLDEDECIHLWCQILDDKWKSQGVCMADLDIGTDSYVLFPCKTSDLKLLKEYAAQIGENIDFAKNM